MTELRLCKDCKWYKKDWFEHLAGGGDRFDMCLNPVVNGNLVTGKVKGGRFCDMMRLSYGRCGMDAKYFEAREK